MGAIKWMREHILAISGTILVVSIFGLIVALSYFVFKAYLNGPIEDIAQAVGAWNYWVIFFSSFGIIIGGWYFYDTKKKMKKFEELMETNSKSRFTRNLAELEDIAWSLGPEYEKRLAEKKKQLRLK